MLCARGASCKWMDKVPAFTELIVQWGKQMAQVNREHVFRVVSVRGNYKAMGGSTWVL